MALGHWPYCQQCLATSHLNIALSQGLEFYTLFSVQTVPVHVMDVSHIRLNPWRTADFHQNFNGQKWVHVLQLQSGVLM